jgi:hypothetical protein
VCASFLLNRKVNFNKQQQGGGGSGNNIIILHDEKKNNINDHNPKKY